MDFLKPIEARKLPISILNEIVELMVSISVSLVIILSTYTDRKKAEATFQRFYLLAKLFLIPTSMLKEKSQAIGNPKNRSENNPGDVAVAEYEAEFYAETKPIVAWYITRLIESFLETMFDVSIFLSPVCTLFSILLNCLECLKVPMKQKNGLHTMKFQVI